MDALMIAYILSAAAAAAVGWVLWRTVVAAGDLSTARFDLEGALGADGRQKRPIDRFIDPGTLLRMRLLCAVLPAAVLPCLLSAAGVNAPLFLAAAAVLPALAGWMLPLLRYRRLVRRRQALFEKHLLDFIIGLANALRAGMALPQAVDLLAAQTRGPMREELDIVRAEYRLGLDVGDTFARLAERMPCEDVRLLAAAVRLSLRTGASLADVLVDMGETIRQRRAFHDKLVALTEQGRFEGLALGCMPPVAFGILHAIRPDTMSLLYTTRAGWAAIGVVCVLEVIGFICVSRISKVED